VRFPQKRVWPDYDGAAGDTIDIEIYEHWLEKA
jgi:nitrile hydratase subunit beta